MSNLNDAILLKLGGSVITYKDKTPPKTHFVNLKRIANELQCIDTPMIIVLGGGAHGHQAASSFGYGNPDTPVSKLLSGIPKIRHNMNELSSVVETILNSEGISSIVVAPFMFTLLDAGHISSFPIDIFSRIIDAGHNVITHGDVCFDSQYGSSILSGDTILTHLAKTLGIKRMLIGTDVDGVMDDNPKVNPHAKIIPHIDQSNMELALGITGPSSSTDVTGGMAKKIADILSISGSDMEVTIFNLTVPQRLERLLKGIDIPCTRIIV